MKKTFYILIIFMTLFFAGNIFAFTPTFYVGDGVTGQATQCLNPTYDSIAFALLDLKSQGILSANLVVCEGTYNEQVLIADSANIFILGENENVSIVSNNQTSAGLIITRSEDIIIKNIDIKSDSKNAIMITDSKSILLENIRAHDIKDLFASGDALSAILINNSSNITLKGNITIDVIRKDNKEINGLEVRYSDDIKIEDGTFTIDNIKSLSTDSTATVNGIKVIGGNITTTSPITITNLQGQKNINGIFLDNNSSFVVLAGETNINNLEGNTEVKAINLINDSSFVTSAKLNINKIGEDKADVYGIYLKKSNLGSFIEINISEVKGNLKTYGLYLEESNFLVSTINLSNNKTENLVRGIEVIDSEGMIMKVNQSNEQMTLNTNNYRLLNINNSKVSIDEMQVNSNNTPFCIYTENQTELNLTNINLSKCSQNHITNKDSKITIKESIVSLDKLFLQESLESFIEVYKPVNFKFLSNGFNIDMDGIVVYNTEESNLYEKIKSNSFKEDILYLKKEYKNNVLETNTFSEYFVIGLLSRINEEAIKVNFENLNYQEIELNFEFLPLEFLEMSALINGNREIIDHFSVKQKACSKVLDKSYGCYEIKPSQELLSGEEYILKFKIPDTWLIAKNASFNNINLYHYESGKYVLLETEMLKEENGFYIYHSEVHSFSEFQISGEEIIDAPEIPEEPPLVNPDGNAPDVNTPDTNQGSNCNITCNNNQTLDSINCICVNNAIEECNITCDPDYEYLDREICQCIDISERLGCKIECNAGQRLDRVNCECIDIVQDDIRYGTGFYNFITYLVLLVIILALIIVIIKLRKKKSSKDNKNIKKKKK